MFVLVRCYLACSIKVCFILKKVTFCFFTVELKASVEDLKKELKDAKDEIAAKTEEVMTRM